MKLRVRKKPLKNGRYSLYLDIYHLGKRKYEFLNLYLTKDRQHNKEVKRLAENIRAKRELELANNNYGFIPDFKKRISLVNYFEKYADEYHKWSNVQSSLKHLKNYLNGKDITFNELDEQWFEGFKDYLLSCGIKQNTAHNYFSILKRVIRQAVKEKIVNYDLSQSIDHIKQKSTKREYLLLDEIKTLVNTECKYPEYKRAFLFACFTGLRFSDLKALKWENVKKDSLEFKAEKTEDYQYIPLGESAKALLYQNDKNSKVVHLPEKNVFQLPNRWFYNEILKRWFKDANIYKNASSHIARHTFATMNLTEGNEIFTVSKLLRHKNLSTTQIYAKIIDETKKKAVDRLPKLENL